MGRNRLVGRGNHDIFIPVVIVSYSFDTTFTGSVVQFPIDLWQDLFAEGILPVTPATLDVSHST